MVQGAAYFMYLMGKPLVFLTQKIMIATRTINTMIGMMRIPENGALPPAAPQPMVVQSPPCMLVAPWGVDAPG